MVVEKNLRIVVVIAGNLAVSLEFFIRKVGNLKSEEAAWTNVRRCTFVLWKKNLVLGILESFGDNFCVRISVILNRDCYYG